MKDAHKDQSDQLNQPHETKTPAALREEAVLAFWEERNIFEKSLLKESPKGNFVFYDGPPYATGMPHYGHMLPSTVKDIIPRYKTMQGYSVPRRWGWDCHGLPIENLIEKELGLKDKKAIESYGIEKFNKAARDSVFRYASDWKRIITRMGRWVDMDNDYQTMDTSYTESVWWSFKNLNEKGLVYSAFKVMPFCPRCQTPLSNFEVGQGYKDIPDISVYVKFELEIEKNTFFLAWTTTPWTLSGNMALAINPELEYVKVQVNTGDFAGQKFIFGKERLATILEKGKIAVGDVGTIETDAIKMGAIEIINTYKGAELEGLSYRPLFDFYTKEGSLTPDQETKRKNLWKVYAADFVTADDGTGVVHIAAFGDDDAKLAAANDIPLIQHVATSGEIKPENGTLSGMQVKPKENPQQTDIEVIKLLAHQGSLFAKEKIIHSYPHCWRCETPLLNYATSSWFVKATQLRDKLVAENKTIKWIPKEVGEGRFGDWLENVRDWAISRTRYWGAPLPVWVGEKTGKTEFIGSVAELAEHIPNNGNTLFIMRHGEAESNIKNVINSHPNDLNKYALTEKGRSEVEESAKKLQQKEIETGKKITKIYTSDFRRTRETAEMVASILGLDHKHIVFDARLREVNVGDFDGKEWPHRAEYLKTLHDKIFKKSPNGESVADVKYRGAEFLYEIEKKHTHENILIVTHGLPLRMLTNTIAGKTCRDLLRSGWTDVSDPTASIHERVFKPFPHNENYELDIHRPYIDSVIWTTPEGDVMRRVPDVFDVWYDSGSMPFAQAHYPFENKEAFEAKGSSLFPADFIAEGLDQTRGWFYSLLVLGMGLFDRSPYKNVAVNGLILAEDGRKMSKSLKNYPDLEPTLHKYGVDSLRYMLAASPAVHAEEVAFSEKGLDEINKKICNRLENVYTFYALYADSQNIKADENSNTLNSSNVLDLWIYSRLSELKQSIESNLDLYQIDKAARPIADFVDDLSTWYLRRSRDRFKGDDIADKKLALETTRFVLINFSKLIAPFMPFMAEHIYQKMRADKGENKVQGNMTENMTEQAPESVHLCSWPEFSAPNEENLKSMAAVREIVETGLAMRSKAGIKVRQPLASLTYDSSKYNFDENFTAIIADELNVKNISKGSDTVLDTAITQELKEEGFVRDIMRAVQEMRKNTGLEPSDSISLHIHVSSENDNEALKRIVGSYEKDIQKTVGAKTVEFTVSAAKEEGGTSEENSLETEFGKITLLIKVI